jgi:uncharacterized membrane protein YraQ (UPF0718 family)
MSWTAVGIDSVALVCLLLSLLKSREKTLTALRIAWNALKRLAPGVLAIIAVIGLIVGFVPPSWILSAVGSERGILGAMAAALLGAVLFIPGIIAFPLAASLHGMGAGTTAVAAFITTLTMIGFVFLPLEIKELGRRFTLVRNGLSFLAALVVALLMGLVLGG